MPTPSIVELDARAVLATLPLIDRIRPADLGRRTPCTEWSLGELLVHLTVQHRGFAAAATGRGSDLTRWQPQPEDADPVPACRAAAEEVLAAFAHIDDPERPLLLPEISTTTTFPAHRAISFHLVDYVVHGWDVARSLGADVAFDNQVIEAALQVARTVPDGPDRRDPGSMFKPSVEGAAADPAGLHLVLRLLGRSPHWSPGT